MYINGIYETSVVSPFNQLLLCYGLTPSPQSKYPSLLSRARGLGALAAIDLPDGASRDKLVDKLCHKGTNAAMSLLKKKRDN